MRISFVIGTGRVTGTPSLSYCYEGDDSMKPKLSFSLLTIGFFLLLLGSAESQKVEKKTIPPAPDDGLVPQVKWLMKQAKEVPTT